MIILIKMIVEAKHYLEVQYYSKYFLKKKIKSEETNF